MADTKEIGRTGLPYSLGHIREEFLLDLQGEKGVRIYREMRDNDPIVGAVFFAIEMLIRGVTWRVDKGGDSQEDEKAANLVETSMADMSMSFSDVLTEALSMLAFGWSYHEIVYKYRRGDSQDPTQKSKFNDGLLGWRKLPIRAQESFWQWLFDEEDGSLRGLEQRPAPKFQVLSVPIEKALLFRTRVDKGNPEGRSILRNAYRPWYFKRRIEEIEGVGIERDLAGLPVLTPPQDVDLWNPSYPNATLYRNAAEKMVRSVRRDENEGVVKPFGWTLELLTTGGRRNFDTSAIIERYDRRIAMVVMADFILLGHEKVGSFSLASSKTGMFTMAIRGWLMAIRDVFNTYAIPRLMAANGWRLESPPQLAFNDIETPDLAELGAYLEKLFQIGFPLFPNEALESYLMQAAKLPERSEDEQDELDEGDQGAGIGGTPGEAAGEMPPGTPQAGGDEPSGAEAAIPALVAAVQATAKHARGKG